MTKRYVDIYVNVMVSSINIWQGKLTTKINTVLSNSNIHREESRPGDKISGNYQRSNIWERILLMV